MRDFAESLNEVHYNHITLLLIFHSSQHVFGELNQLGYVKFRCEAMLVVVQDAVPGNSKLMQTIYCRLPIPKRMPMCATS